MPDPLDALRAPVPPAEPDPTFAARLRAELERALLGPNPAVRPLTETERSTLEEEPVTTPTTTVTPTPTLREFTPYLSVVDARRMIAFYVDAFGAEHIGEPIVMPDGRIGHAELRLGALRVFLAEEFPEYNLRAPNTQGGASVTLHLSYPRNEDVDTIAGRAEAAGGTLDRPVADGPYGRSGTVIDPSGHRWIVNAEPDTQSSHWTPGHGDVGYLTYATRDTARFREFYGALLGWTFDPGYVTDGWQARGVTPLTGVHSAPEPGIVPQYCVRDLDAALAVVREKGGVAGEPHDEPYGRTAECTDDQGAPFYLLEY